VLRVLVTRRVPLHLRGEREYLLALLSLSQQGQRPPSDHLVQYAVVALGREALALAREVGDVRRCAEELEQLARGRGGGLGGTGGVPLGAAATLRGMLGAPLPAPDRTEVEQAVAAAQATLGEEA